MKLPNGDRVFIPMEKITGYCLNPNHSKGKHKARVFRAILGITIENADQLVALIQQAVVKGEVVQQDLTPKGQAKKYHPSHSGTIVGSHLASSNAGCQKYSHSQSSKVRMKSQIRLHLVSFSSLLLYSNSNA